MRTKNLKALLAVTMVGGAVAFSSVALAVPTLRISDGTTTVQVVDGGTQDTSGVAGSVGFNGSVGDFQVVMTTGFTKPLIGTANLPEIDLNSIQATSSAAGILTISFSETDFLGGGNPTVFSSGIGGGSLQGTVAFSAYVDDGNALFGEGTQVANIGPLGLSNNFSGGDTGIATVTGPFSITQVVKVDHLAGTSSSFNATTSVPEPATLMLLGAGLLGIGAATRRRRNQA